MASPALAEDLGDFMRQSDLFHDEYLQDLKVAEQTVISYSKDTKVDQYMLLLAAARVARLQGIYTQAASLLRKALEIKDLNYLTRMRLLVEFRLVVLERFSPQFGGYDATTADIRCLDPELRFQAVQLDELLQSVLSQADLKGKSQAVIDREKAELRQLLVSRRWAEGGSVLRELSQHQALGNGRPMLANMTTEYGKALDSESATEVQAGWLRPMQRDNLAARRVWPLRSLLFAEDAPVTPPEQCTMPGSGLWHGDGLLALVCAERQLFPLGSPDDLGLWIESPHYEWVTSERFRQQWAARQPPLLARQQAAQPLLAVAHSQLVGPRFRRARLRLQYVEVMSKLAWELAGKLPEPQAQTILPELESLASAAAEVADRRLLRQIVAMGTLVKSLRSPTAASVDWLDKLLKMSIEDGDYGQLLGWGRLFAAAAAQQAFTAFRPDAADVLYSLALRFYQAAGAPLEASQLIQRQAEMLRSAGATSRAVDAMQQGLTLLAANQTECKLKPTLPAEHVISRAALLSDSASIFSELGQLTELRRKVAELRAYGGELLRVADGNALIAAEQAPLPATLRVRDPLLQQATALLLAARRAKLKSDGLVAQAKAAAAAAGPGGDAARARWRQLFEQNSALVDAVLTLQQAMSLAHQAHWNNIRLQQLEYTQSIRDSEDDINNVCDNARLTHKSTKEKHQQFINEIENQESALEPYLRILLEYTPSFPGEQAKPDTLDFIHNRSQRSHRVMNFRMTIERKMYAAARESLRIIEQKNGVDWYSRDTQEPWNGLELVAKLYAGLYGDKAATKQQVLDATQRMIESFERRRIATRDERMRALLAQQPQGGSIYATAVDASGRIGDAPHTLDYIERAKAKALQERVLLENNPAAIRALNLGSALNMIDVTLARTGCAGGSGEPQCLALRERSQALLREYEEQRQLSPLFAGTSPPSLAELQAALPEKTALLDYFLSEGAITAVLLTKESAKVAFRRPASPVYFKKVVRRVRDRLDVKAEVPSCELAWLAEMTLPAGDELARLSAAGITNLVLVPHGVLHDIPFAALPVGKRRLIEQFVLRELPYAGLLKRAPSPAAAKATAAVLYYDGDPESGRSANAQQEAEMVAKLYDNSVPQAVLDRQQLLSAFRDYQGVYFVGHAVGSKDNENLFGKIDLPRVSPIDSGDLSVIDIVSFADPFRARWVFLSACEGARSNHSLGAEGLGMAQALLQKGVRTVLANLVTEKSQSKSPQILTPLIAALRVGDDPATALSMMQRAAIQNRSPLHSWASLVAIGGF